MSASISWQTHSCACHCDKVDLCSCKGTFAWSEPTEYASQSCKRDGAYSPDIHRVDHHSLPGYSPTTPEIVEQYRY